jgi:hypothetical protein
MAAKTQFFNALVADAMCNVDGSEPFSFPVDIDGDRAVITQESLEAVCLEMGNMIIVPLSHNNIDGSYDAIVKHASVMQLKHHMWQHNAELCRQIRSLHMSHFKQLKDVENGEIVDARDICTSADAVELVNEVFRKMPELLWYKDPLPNEQPCILSDANVTIASGYFAMFIAIHPTFSKTSTYLTLFFDAVNILIHVKDVTDQRAKAPGVRNLPKQYKSIASKWAEGIVMLVLFCHARGPTTRDSTERTHSEAFFSTKNPYSWWYVYPLLCAAKLIFGAMININSVLRDNPLNFFGHLKAQVKNYVVYSLAQLKDSSRFSPDFCKGLLVDIVHVVRLFLTTRWEFELGPTFTNLDSALFFMPNETAMCKTRLLTRAPLYLNIIRLYVIKPLEVNYGTGEDNEDQDDPMETQEDDLM